MRRVLLSGTVLAVLLACDGAPTAPASPSRPEFAAGGASQKFPFDQIAFAPCANGGTGEDIELTGTLNFVVVDQTSAAGTEAIHFAANPQGATGLGLTTGTVYRATGITLETVTLTTGVSDTFVNNFRIIGPGLTANLLIHEVFHATVNANGVLTVIFDRATAECTQG
jgi:hypothetical protein